MIKYMGMLFFICLLTGGSTLTMAASGNSEPLICEEHSFKVALTPADVTQYKVIGTLCARSGFQGKTLQLLISGATYSRVYWDFPYRNQRYSYVRAATAHGYASFNLERIGIGRSDHPPGALVTGASHAYIIHQIIAKLRDGALGIRFPSIVAVGHSLGSYIAVDLAANYPGDVQGVILTGFLHNINPEFFPLVEKYFYPATYDALFWGQFPNLDYLTTRPDSRKILFYHSPAVEDNVVIQDEITKETVTTGEFISDPHSLLSLRIQVPVMVLVGEYDHVVCGGVVNCLDPEEVRIYEQQYFSPQACLETFVMAGSGHNLNLHRNAKKSYAVMLKWVDTFIGRDAVSGPPCG